MLRDYLSAAVANECKAALVSQRIATDSKVVSRDEDELDESALEQISATGEYFEFRALYVAMKDVQSFNRLGFHKVWHADTRYKDFAGFLLC